MTKCWTAILFLSVPKHIIAYIYHYVRDFSKSQNVPNLTQASLKERRKINNVEKKYRDEGFRIFPFPVPSRVREWCNLHFMRYARLYCYAKYLRCLKLRMGENITELSTTESSEVKLMIRHISLSITVQTGFYELW